MPASGTSPATATCRSSSSRAMVSGAGPALFYPDTRVTGGLFAGTGLLAATALAVAFALGMSGILAGVALFIALVVGAAAAILGYRLFYRPVMLRVDGNGVFFKRLAVTIPWEAMDRIDIVPIRNGHVAALREKSSGHPIFDEQGVLLGATLNRRAGLPPLAVSMQGLDGTLDGFLMAVRRVGAVPINDPREHPMADVADDAPSPNP